MSREDDFSQPIRSRGLWSTWFRSWYRMLRLAERPLVWLTLSRGFGNLVILRVAGRRTGTPYRTPLGLLSVGDAKYIGHPSGDAGWTLNVRASEAVEIEHAGTGRRHVSPHVLGHGAEREAVLRATFRQHPFPANLMYRLAGQHIQTHGVFFRLDEVGDERSVP